MVCGLFRAPDADTVSAPLKLVAPFLGGSLVRSIETRTSVSVAPLLGWTTIHGLLLAAFQASDAPVLVKSSRSARRTQRGVEFGLRQNPMALSLKASDGGNGATARSFTTTATFWGEYLAPAAEMVTVPKAQEP